MEPTANLILYVHIAAGFTALVVGPFAMFSSKEARLHHRAGSI